MILEQQLIIKKQLEKGPLWKCVVFGLLCIKQEFEVYRCLAEDQAYNMTKFLDKTMERFWKAAASGYGINEKFLLAIEESFFEAENEWDEIALKVVKDIYGFFYAVENKNKENAVLMQNRQIELIRVYLDAIGEKFSEDNKLVIDTLEFQNEVFKNLEIIQAKDKKRFIGEYEKQKIEPIMRSELLANRSGIKKERPAKKKLPEIRFMSLDFERERSKITEEEYLKIAEEELHRLNGIAYWLKHWEDFLKTPEKQLGERDFIDNRRNNKEPDYIDFYHYLQIVYRLMAESAYVHTLKEESVIGYWYLSALSTLKMKQLIKNGDFRSEYMQYYIDKHIPVIGAMLLAVAANEFELVKMLSSYAENRSEWEEAKMILKVVENRDEEAIEILNNIKDKVLYQELFLLALKKKDKELRKAIIKMIEADRKAYNLNRTMVDPVAFAAIRLVENRGVRLEIHAAEVLNSKLNINLTDKSKWLLPGEEGGLVWNE